MHVFNQLKNSRTKNTRRLNPYFFAAQIQIPIPNKYLGSGYKCLLFCRNNGYITENIDKGLTVPKWVLIVWLEILQMPKHLSAQFVSSSPKVLDFNEKSFIGYPQSVHKFNSFYKSNCYACLKNSFFYSINFYSFLMAISISNFLITNTYMFWTINTFFMPKINFWL